MYRIKKRFEFSAAHRLNQLPDSHPCSCIHGHNYSVEFVMEREELDDRSFVMDYRDLDPLKTFLEEKLDHRMLNDCMPDPPTVENIARFLYETFKPKFPELCMVRISETPNTWCEYFEST